MKSYLKPLPKRSSRALLSWISGVGAMVFGLVALVFGAVAFVLVAD